MTARRASLPSMVRARATTPRRRRRRHDMRRCLQTKKRAIALNSTAADACAVNVARARREGWRDGKIRRPAHAGPVSLGICCRRAATSALPGRLWPPPHGA